MPEALTTTDAAATTTTAATTATASPWHAGIDADTIGHWQNKGWSMESAKDIALQATKQAREAEKYFGVPHDQLLKMPKSDAKPDEIKAFWGRLGAVDAKDYDLAGIKFAGNDLEASFADAMRKGLAAAFVPKDKAHLIVKEVVGFLEGAESAENAVATAKIAEEKATLAKDWGPNFDFNHLKAMEGARRLGITPEAVKALEGQIGYKAVMEAMRKIGAGTSEDTFHEGGGHRGGPTTREGAVARLNQLQADTAWCARLLKGDQETTNEWRALTIQIEGEAA